MLSTRRARSLVGASIVALSIGGTAFLPQAPAQPPPPRMGGMHHMMGRNGAGGERHPALNAALAALNRAKIALQRANRDFGGHRTLAVKHVDEAINEVQLALKFDRK